MINLLFIKSLNTKNVAFYCGAIRDIDSGAINSIFEGKLYNFETSSIFETGFTKNEFNETERF